jgi:hypothetical protein
LRETSARTKKANPAAIPPKALSWTLPKRNALSEQVAAISTMVMSKKGRDSSN